MRLFYNYSLMLNFENLNKLQTTFFGEDHFFIYLIALTIWRLFFIQSMKTRLIGL
jgi:hypothetical protein